MIAKLKWVLKLISSRHFILITDREAVIRIRNGGDLNDKLIHSQQRGSLERFREHIDVTIREVDRFTENKTK